jgi:hypothetical protein
VIQFWGGGIPGIVRFIDCRTQWFDDAVKAAIRSGIKQVGELLQWRALSWGAAPLSITHPPSLAPPLAQVVVIAAGYDTRAYRLAQPGVRFYEIDLPHASQHKQDLVRKLLPAAEVCCWQPRHWPVLSCVIPNSPTPTLLQRVSCLPAPRAFACVPVQYPPPEFVAADLSKVRLDDALAGTSFNPEQPTLFTVGE